MGTVSVNVGSCYFEEDTRTIEQKTKEKIKNIKKDLKHEEKKLECINKLKGLGIDIEILKEVLR